MSRKAAMCCEPETETLVHMSKKTVTIGVKIDPAGTFELSLPAVGDVWPGDTLVWNVSNAGVAGTLIGKTLAIELHRIREAKVTTTCLAETFSLQQTLPVTLTVETRDSSIDGTDGPDDATHHRVGSGHKITFDTKALARKPGKSGSYLVIDTSGPPAGGGGGGGTHPCPDPDDPDETDRYRHHGILG